MASGNSEGQASSRAQRAVVLTWMRWSVFERSGVGIGREGSMLRVWVGTSKTTAFMVGGSFGMVDDGVMVACGCSMGTSIGVVGG